MNLDEYRCSRVTVPGEYNNDYFSFVDPRIFSRHKAVVYIRKEDLESLKKGAIPEYDNFSIPGYTYYSDTNGRFAGYAHKGYFFNSPEIVNYLMSDSDFVNRAIKENITWFFINAAYLFLI